MSEAEIIESPAEATPAAPAESLLPTPAAETPPAEPEFSFADKVMVKDGEAVNWEQTARKAEQARQHLEKRLGSGDAPPKDVAGYEFAPPEDLKDFELKAERLDAFKAEALANGINAAQFKWMMSSYLKAAPDLMEGAAKMTAAQAKAALQGVWTAPGEFEAGLAAAQKAAAALPKALQEDARAHGTDPTMLRVLAWVGAQLGEDKPINTAVNAPASSDANKLMASEAYRNPRHPDHATVSAQVAKFFNSQPGADLPL